MSNLSDPGREAVRSRRRGFLALAAVATFAVASATAASAIAPAVPIPGTCVRDEDSPIIAEFELLSNQAIWQNIPNFPAAPELLAGGNFHGVPLHVVVFKEHHAIPIIGGLWPEESGESVVLANVVCIETPLAAPIYFVDVNLEGLAN
jgi:hypothetical protein